LQPDPADALVAGQHRATGQVYDPLRQGWFSPKETACAISAFLNGSLVHGTDEPPLALNTELVSD